MSDPSGAGSAAGPIDPVPPAGGGGPPDDDAIDKLIFKRDVDEVHLLIDFISGRADKNLTNLEIPNPAYDPTVQPPMSPTLNSTEAVKHLALIRYPPSKIERVKAEDAALLLLARDRLAALASPARSATIAYTEMFIGSEVDGRDYRRNLAVNTFPNLVSHVSKFKKLYIGLICLTFIWLILTALTYWDVAMGRSILQGIDQLNKEKATIVQSNPAAATCAASSTDAICARVNTLTEKMTVANSKLSEFINCTADCKPVFHVVRWGFLLCGFDPEEPVDGTDKFLTDRMAFVLTVFSTYILPMMFGLLGTMIAAVRAIQSKVRDYELGPRDLILTLMGLPIGLVAGVAVGLFYAPSAAPTTGTGNLAGELSLSAVGLGFLAGYGSEAFFKSLDALLARVFTARASTPPPAARQN
ncbi:MAG TPA: hypothetical protein VN900_05355 [Stellaceae bacterium]|nr:hypothetical protein [Stellaceae bacterium]